MPARAYLYDGVSALRHEGSLVLEGDQLSLLRDDGGTDGPFPLAGLRRVVSPTAVLFERRDAPGWRLGLVDRHDPILALLPAEGRYGHWIDRFGFWRAAGMSALVAALVVFIVLKSPAILARLIPQAVEQQLGDAMIGDFGGRICSTPQGDAALATMMARIDPDHTMRDVEVANIPIVNAVTLPGGRIVVFDKLIQEAKSPDEVAGVIAHEMGHVQNRDVMESLLRQLGLSVLLGGMEGHVGGYTDAILSAGYTRGAEQRADDAAITQLRLARISPRPTAQFFVRLSEPGTPGRAQQMLAYLATHPDSRARARNFAAGFDKNAAYPVSLGSDQWQALRSICRDDARTQKAGWRF